MRRVLFDPTVVMLTVILTFQVRKIIRLKKVLREGYYV